MPDAFDRDDPVVVPIGPELDLHSFQPREVASVVAEYVREACGAGLSRVRIVHGRGRGVQRGVVQATLERHPDVRAFWDDPDARLGATIAELQRAGSDPGV
ncbi:MAG TPA: Smr/MutS family protein [Vicinamibacterales bacterium]|nr:Smr/MutS family protein [Vicinamibacterales bacterium]